jgi:hypothetical protein
MNTRITNAEIRNHIPMHLGKIRSIIFNMAQERRIRSAELDDLNQTLRSLSEQFDIMIEATECMEREAKGIAKLKSEHADIKYKMEVCLELSGMSKVGIRHLMGYPTCFLELALALRVRKGIALEREVDFLWLTNLWQGLSSQIENDMDSFRHANFLKQIYSQESDPLVKQQVVRMMNGFAEELAYLRTKLGKDMDESELLNLIRNHWYELYRHNTSEKDC